MERYKKSDLDCLQIYHINWLKNHSHRTITWLRVKLKEGFDIHHINGDHNSNDPSNLVLIEHTDHLRLHNNKFKGLGRLLKRRKSKKEKVDIKEKETPPLLLMFSRPYRMG